MIDLTRDLTELKRRKLSAPSQPNLLSITSRDFAAPSKPSDKPEDVAAREQSPGELSIAKQLNIVMDDTKTTVAVKSGEPSDSLFTDSHLQAPPSPFIPDSVIKSLKSPSAATLPSSATTPNCSSALAVFSTASLGRRRKRSLRGGSSEMNLASQQRIEFEDRVRYLEDEVGFIRKLVLVEKEE